MVKKYKINYKHKKKIGGSSYSSSNINFKKNNLEFYIPIIFTFLDGKLNPEYGSSLNSNLHFLINHLNNEELKNTFRIIYESIIKIKDEFKNIDNKIIEMIHYEKNNNFKNTKLLQDEINFKFEKYIEINKDIIKNYNFLFIHLKSHYISFYLEMIDDNFFYLVLINSGGGIEYHNKIKIYHENKYENLYNLWKVYEINKNDLDNVLNNLLKFNLYNEYFEKLNNLLGLNFENSNNIILKDILNFMKNNYSFENQIINIYGMLEKYESKQNNFFNKNTLINFKKNWEEKKNNDYLSAYFFLYNFEIIDNDLYTNPQKSGSCAWFSIYWLLVAFLIKHDAEPIEFIHNLIGNFLENIKDIFKSNNIFLNNYDNLSLLDYSLINMLYNIKILENDVYYYLEKVKNLEINYTISDIIINSNNFNMSNRTFLLILIDLVNKNTNINILNTLIKDKNDYQNNYGLKQLFFNFYLKKNKFNLRNNNKYLFLLKNNFSFINFTNNNSQNSIINIKIEDEKLIKFIIKINKYIRIKNFFLYEIIDSPDNLDENNSIIDSPDNLYENNSIIGYTDKIDKIIKISLINDKKLSNNKKYYIGIKIDESFNDYLIDTFFDIYDFNLPINNLSITEIVKNNYIINFIKFYDFIKGLIDSSNSEMDLSNIFNNDIYIIEIDNLFNIMKIYNENENNKILINYKSSNIIKQYYAKYNYIIYINGLIYDLKKNYKILPKYIFSNYITIFNKDKKINNNNFEKIIFDLIKNFYYYNDKISNLNDSIYLLFYMMLDINLIENYNLGDNINNINPMKMQEVIVNLDKYYFKQFKNFKEMKENLLLLFNNNLIYAKYFSFKDDNIIYNEDIYVKLDKNQINKYFLLNFINTDKSPINCYYNMIKNKYILKNDLINVDSYYDEKFLVIFIEMNNNNKIQKMKINDYEVVLDKDIKKYPFLIFEPVLCNSYILRKKNTYYLLILANGYDDKNFKILTNKDFINSSILILEIGNNFLFPKFKKIKQIKMLKNIYCDYGCKIQVMFNFNLQDDEGLFRLKNYNVKENNINNFNYCNEINEELKNLDNCVSSSQILTSNCNDLNRNSINLDKENILNKLKLRYKDLSNKLDIDKIYISNILKSIPKNSLQEFIMKNPICEFDCKNIKELNDLLNSSEKNLEHLRNDLTNKINFEEYSKGGIFEILYKNYQYLFIIMQTNILLNNIDRIKNIIDECDEQLSCQEIAEINSYLLIPDIFEKELNISFISLVFELLFGFIIKEEQWEKFNLIYQNYKNKDNQLRIVNQFMMGKGKSSVIMPLLLLNLYNDSEKINIVVPTHLLNQTKNDLSIYKMLFNIDFDVIDDYQAKFKLVNNKFKDNDLFIFDEFDMMFDPLQSNFNLVSETGKDFFEKNHIEKVIDIIQDKKVENNPFNNEILNILNTNDIKNISYGMSKNNRLTEDNLFERWVIPYARENTPIEGSNFSSLLVTLVLTVKYFKENDYKFEEKDLINMFRKGYFMIFTDYIIDEIDYVEIALKEQNNYNLENRIQLVIDYLDYFVIKNLKYNESVKNCSFIDLMNAGCWATGFSGTINIDLPDIKQGASKFSNVMIQDFDEVFGVYFALTGTYPNSSNKIYEYIDYNSIYDILKNKIYNCLIDISALFKDFSSKDVIRNILNLSQYKEFLGIYINQDNNIKTIDRYDNENDFIKFPKENFIIFFSQRNIVGIDIPNQPNNMIGLAIIDENEKYTNVAQGIFRMRKLNKGQIIDIAYNGNFNEENKNRPTRSATNLLESLDSYSLSGNYLTSKEKIPKEKKEEQNQNKSNSNLVKKFTETLTEYKTHSKSNILLSNDLEILENIEKKIKIYEKLKLNDLTFKEYKKSYLKLQNLKFLIRNTNNNNYIQNEMKPLFIRYLNNEDFDIRKIFDVQINWNTKINDKYIKDLRDELINNPEVLESILFSGFVQEQEQVIQINKSIGSNKNQDLEMNKINKINILFYPGPNIKLLFFPNDNDDIENLLSDSYPLIEANDKFSLFLTIDFFKRLYLDSDEYYFIEFTENYILLIIDYNNKYDIRRAKMGDFRGIMLYLRDFPVYNSLGFCINNDYHNFGPKDNLFNRYGGYNIFSILRKILNYNFLSNQEINLLQNNYRDNFIFNLFLYMQFDIKNSEKFKINDDLEELNKNVMELIEESYREENEINNFSKLDEISQEKIKNSFLHFTNFDDDIKIFYDKIILNKDIYNQSISNIKNKILQLYGKDDEYNLHIHRYYDNYINKINNSKSKKKEFLLFNKFIIRILAKYNNLGFYYFNEEIEEIDN